MNKITDLKHYRKNPRKITDKKFELLGSSLERYGDLGGIVVNIRNGEVIGGNQRTRFFQEHAKDVEIQTVKLLKADAQGTVAIGHLIYKGSRFNYREVDWDEKTEKEANILANKATGFFDNEILLNEFDKELLLDTGFDDFELSFFNEKTRPEIDVDNFNDQLDSYLEGEIKQVVLYMDSATYEATVKTLKDIQLKTSIDNNTDVFMEALNHYAKDILK